MNDALQSQINQKIESKELTVYYSADLQRIEPDVAYLLVGDHEVPVKAQHIFVKIGAEMPRGFLEQCGVTFASQDPEALPLWMPTTSPWCQACFWLVQWAGRILLSMV